MGISDREYYKEKHLPDCNCEECSQKRLYESNSGNIIYHLPDNKHPFGDPIIDVKCSEIVKNKKLEQCPFCKERTLKWNNDLLLYECINVKCKRKIAYYEK